ncbi:MAG: hypothetical protein PHP75_08070 [Methylacidiphilaceae bacterium]|nr:hypothetical protein [Candidatus Methylacidiphilaceae bacterium]
MRVVRLGKIGLLSLSLLLPLQSVQAKRTATLVKTSKGYRVTILPVMGAEEVERTPEVAKGKVRIQSLKEQVYGRGKPSKEGR